MSPIYLRGRRRESLKYRTTSHGYGRHYYDRVYGETSVLGPRTTEYLRLSQPYEIHDPSPQTRTDRKIR